MCVWLIAHILQSSRTLQSTRVDFPNQPLGESGILNGGLLDGLEEKHWFTCLAVLDLLPALFVLSRGVNVVVDC